MALITQVSRRQFLKSTGVSAALVLGAQIKPNAILSVGHAQTATSVQPNLFVSIDMDGTVTITCSRSEMGQGVRTGIPMILADELEADWSRVSIWQAPGDETRYDPAGKDGQNTDGSRSTRHHFDVMRELGASARNLLEQAAAQEWDVDVEEVYAEHHRIYHTGTGNSFDYGELVEAAANISVPQGDATGTLRLKDPSEWKYIGRDLPVVDNFDMSTGAATYGADVSLPGMKIAVVARSPVYRGRVRSYNADAALDVQGVEQVVEIPALAEDRPAEFRALGGIAVIGSNTWSVMEGRRRLQIEWDDGPFARHDSSTYDDTLRESARRGGTVVRRRGDVDRSLADADRTVEAEYFVPFLVHTPMEPPVALVDATVRPVRVWAATQAPN
ncbi:MAG: molybdopterin-dependent oxidoreductase, partial [Gammaproteobacteria bacterium]|nr:molybdopterin-dependent oxidoreductase [Gammaproteobacteria bacterium]